MKPKDNNASSETNLVSFLPVSRGQAERILGAMKGVAEAGGGLGPADLNALAAANRHVLGSNPELDLTSVVPPTGDDLAAVLTSQDLRRYAMHLIAIMAFVDGKLDKNKLERAVRYAADLDVNDDYIDDLAEAARGHIDTVSAHMVRHNVESIRGMDSHSDFAAQFLPYDANPDPALTARYRQLGALPYEAFGRAFYDHYSDNNYKFPGEVGALSELFASPHDSLHILSGYSTSVQGEVLVSTFTAATHRIEGMSGHILPVLFSWHLGIALNPVAGSATGAFDGEKFWRAWERGRLSHLDTFAPSWDFWAIVESPLAKLRAGYKIPQLDAAHAAAGNPGPVRPWSE